MGAFSYGKVVRGTGWTTKSYDWNRDGELVKGVESSSPSFGNATIETFDGVSSSTPKVKPKVKPYVYVKPNVYSFRKVTRDYCSGEMLLIERPSPTFTSYTMQTGIAAPGSLYEMLPPFVDDSYNQALSKLYEQMRGSLDLSVALGEHSATLKMFKAASKLSRYILQLHPKHWAKHWLEYKYGWSPLVSDLYATVQEFSRVVPTLLTLKSKATIRDSGEFKVSQSSTDYHTAATWEASGRTRFGVVWEPSTSTLSTLARLSSLNPASIAWELTPFSFVFDWFVDVGSYIRDLESSIVLAGGFRSGFVTTTTKTTIFTKITGLGQISSVRSTNGQSNGCYTVKTMNRKVLLNLPRPDIPRFKPRLGPSRLITSAALLKTLFLSEKMEPKKRRITQKRLQAQLDRMVRSPARKEWSSARYFH